MLFVASALAADFATAAIYVAANSANPTAPYESAQTAARTLADALAVCVDGEATIYVAPGIYESDTGTNVSSAGPSAYEITNAVSIVGMGVTPGEVVFRRNQSGGSFRLFYLNCADAKIANVTIANGIDASDTAVGGNVYIGKDGGTIENCRIERGQVSTWYGGGGNVAMYGGRVSRSILSGGTINPDSLAAGRKGGSCLYMAGGVVENSLVCDNTNGYVAVMMTGNSTLASSTIAGNRGTAGAGVYVSGVDCKVVNCAIGGNVASNDSTGHGHVYLAANDTYISCFSNCATEVDLGEGNRSASDIGFLAAGDYRLSIASVCRDAARDYAQSGAVSELDLAGNPRQSGDEIDIGCYELDINAPAVAFTVDKATVLIGEEVNFTAAVSGSATGSVLNWDFDGDGVIDKTTRELSVSHSYSAIGNYNVRVTAGEAGYEKICCVTVGPRDVFVCAENPAEGEYATIQEAYEIAVDGTTIHVAAGQYDIVGDSVLEITKAVKIVGDGASPSAVVVRQQCDSANWENPTYRTMVVGNKDALIANLTIANGSVYNTGKAGCLIIGAAGGTVSNCVIKGGRAVNLQDVMSAGAYLQNGLLTHSVIEDCSLSAGSTDANGPRAQGVYLEGTACMENCLLRNLKSGEGAAVVVGEGALVRNCTVVDCQVGFYVHNYGTWHMTNACHGVYCHGGTIVNTVGYGVGRVAFEGCLAAGKTSEFAATDFAAMGPADKAANFVACAADASDGIAFGESGRVVASGDFRSAGGGDWRPARGGVLVDGGVAVEGYEWITDLVGKRRVHGKRPDIGCYETVSEGFALHVR